jgi:hypothetical protein
MDEIEKRNPLPYPACQYWKERVKYIIDENGSLTESFPFGRVCELGRIVFEVDIVRCENVGIRSCWQEKQ